MLKLLINLFFWITIVNLNKFSYLIVKLVKFN